MSKQLPPEDPPAPMLVDETHEEELKHDGGYRHGVPSIAPIPRAEQNEPIVTRKELWAYYREWSILRTRGGPLISVCSVLQW